MPTDTTTTAGPEGPRTETEARIWAALDQRPQTTADVVAAAGVGRSTAGKALARWASAGLITRHDGDTATWSHLPDLPGGDPGAPDPNRGDAGASEEPPQPAAPEDAAPPHAPEGRDDEADSDRGGVVGVVPVKPERLQPGGLYGLVEDYLRAHPGEEFSPSQISKDLNRSSGAINNALEKMAARGVAIKTQTAPKRFALAPDETH